MGWLGVAGVIAVMAISSGCMSHEEKILATVEKHVAHALKDPESARFSGAYVVVDSESDRLVRSTACGYVTAKNSFGGYVDPMRYTATVVTGSNILDVSNVQLEGADRRATVDSFDTDKPETVFEKLFWNAKCVDAAHPPTFSGE